VGNWVVNCFFLSFLALFAMDLWVVIFLWSCLFCGFEIFFSLHLLDFLIATIFVGV
jgi:hypothetical protein